MLVERQYKYSCYRYHYHCIFYNYLLANIFFASIFFLVLFSFMLQYWLTTVVLDQAPYWNYRVLKKPVT